MGWKWNTLKDAVDNKVANLQGDSSTFYTAYEFNGIPNPNAIKYNHRKKPVSPQMSSYLDFDGGFTNYNIALTKATEIILNYQH